MKLIKNISPARIKVNISVIETNGQTMSIELNYGECILVSDTGIETKSIIIQKKKGNIEILDKNPNGMVSYQKYLAEPNEQSVQTYDVIYDEPKIEQEIFIDDSKKDVMDLDFDVLLADSEKENFKEKTIEPSANKGGRPKGAGRKPLTKAQLKRKARERYQLKKKNKANNKD